MKPHTYMIICLMFCVLGCSIDRVDFSDKMLRNGNFESSQRWRQYAWKENLTNWQKIHVLFLAGVDSFLHGVDDEAEYSFLEMLDLSPTSYKASFFLGVIAVRRGDYDLAKMRFDEASVAYEMSIEPHSVNEHEECAVLMFYRMMGNVITKNTVEARQQGQILYDTYSDIPWVDNWCCALGVSESRKEEGRITRECYRKLVFIRVWYDAIPCYFRLPLIAHGTPFDQIVRFWTQFHPEIQNLGH